MKVKANEKQSYSCTHHEAMSGNEGICLHIINLSTLWGVGGWIGRRSSLCTLEKKKISCPHGNQKQFLRLSVTVLTELS